MRRAEITWIPRVALATCAALFVVGAIGFGMALYVGALSPFDVHLTLDGRHALVIHHDLPCVPAEPPERACAAGQMRREFQLIYSTSHDDQVLVSITLAAR